MRSSRIDDNQNEIVKALRDMGCSVQSLASVGRGTPDLVIGFMGKNVLIEVKDGSKHPSKCKLTPDQVEWHRGWKGQVCVVENVEQAIEAVTKCHRL